MLEIREMPFDSDFFQLSVTSRQIQYLSQTSAGIKYIEKLGLWLVNDSTYVYEIFMNDKLFSPRNVLNPIYELSWENKIDLVKHGIKLPPTLANNDTISHRKIRSICAKWFGGSQLESFKYEIKNIAETQIKEIMPYKNLDISYQYALTVPSKIVQKIVGLDELDIVTVQKWVRASLQLFWGRLEGYRVSEAISTIGEMYQYIRVNIGNIQNKSGLVKDLSKLIFNDGRAITQDEMTAIILFLLVAGQVTTTQLLNSLIREIYINKNESETDELIQQVLLDDPPLTTWRRVVNNDCDFNGIKFKKNDVILLLLGAANHCINREHKNLDNLSFGSGPHRCLGANFALVEANILIEKLIKVFPPDEVVPTYSESEPEFISFRPDQRIIIDRIK